MSVCSLSVATFHSKASVTHRVFHSTSLRELQLLISYISKRKRTRTHVLGDFVATNKYGAYWLLLVSVDVKLN